MSREGAHRCKCAPVSHDFALVARRVSRVRRDVEIAQHDGVVAQYQPASGCRRKRLKRAPPLYAMNCWRVSGGGIAWKRETRTLARCLGCGTRFISCK